MSPFNAAGKRQTTFAAVDVMPEINDDIVVEINEEIVDKTKYNETTIQDGDVVEIISFMGGG